MAGYLTYLTWVLLLALCYTPAPAHSENLGLSRGHGNRHVRQALEEASYFYDGGVDATNPSTILTNMRKGTEFYNTLSQLINSVTQFIWTDIVLIA
ncbi:hypothetical protein Hamer_G028882, partial [Homarus americanus]